MISDETSGSRPVCRDTFRRIRNYLYCMFQYGELRQGCQMVGNLANVTKNFIGNIFSCQKFAIF